MANVKSPKRGDKRPILIAPAIIAGSPCPDASTASKPAY